MNGTTKRRVGIGALTGLVIAGVIGVTSLNVSGQVTTTADPYPATAYGTLTLALANRAGSVTLELVDGTTITQAIKTTQPCAKIILDPIFVEGVAFNDPTATLLDFVSLTGTVLPAGGTLAPGGTVQIPSTLLGVESGTNCGTPSGQLGPNEALKVSLGSFFDIAASPDVSVVSGTLAIGKTNSQDKDLQLAYDKDTYTAGDFTSTPIPVGGTTVTSGAFAESITLRSTATSNSRGLSLKGGTTFNLGVPGEFDFAVDCDEIVTDTGSAGEIASSATFYRAQDNKGANQCTDEVGITVEILSDRVFWNNATIGVNGVEQSVAGLVTIAWAPIATSDGPAAVQAQLAREIDYDAATGGESFVPVQWCSSFTELPEVNGVRAFDVDMPAGVPWCLVSDSQELEGGNVMQTQVYYGQGDPYNR